VLRGQPGEIVSMLPFGGDAHGIRTEGLEYPLRDESLFVGPARGVSNVMLDEEATVLLRQGMLLCVMTSSQS
jgi:thiamine pyrophosphokinase